MKYTCPVCGYPELVDPPRGPDGGASEEICPSCGFQFGYTDDDQGISYEQWRADWIAQGMPWSSVGIHPPSGWDPVQQLQTVLGKDN